MTRSFFPGTIMLLTSLTAFAASDQFRQNVERNIQLLQKISDCTEGYASTVEGSSLVYSSFRPEPERALITRATTGSMAIAWKTPPVPPASGKEDLSFVVTAGMYGQQPSGFTFHVSINDIPRFDFFTTPNDTWEVKGKEGGSLHFLGIVKDKYGDVFGCLRISIPRTWVKPGEQATIKIVGEKANQSAWFMVFEVGNVVSFQKDLVKNEAYSSVVFHQNGSRYTVNLEAPSSWQGLAVSLAPGQGMVLTRRFEARDGSSFATFDIPRKDLASPLTISMNNEPLLRLDTLFSPIGTTLVYPLRVVSLTAPAPDATGWHVSYQSEYQPGLGASLQAFSAVTEGQGTQHLIVSTHQDIAWMDSPENCVRDRDEKIITPLLDIMKNNPAYHFDLEDVLCLREYLDRHPDRKKEIHQLMLGGRLGVGASFNQPYEDLCSGEMLVRQFYAGRRWLRKQFPGVDTKTYWNPDVPGRTLQMPQVMHKAGVENLVMSRFARGLYSWYSPDGSRVTAFSPGHYGDFKARVEGVGFEQAAGYVASTATDWLEATHHISRDVPLVSMSDMSGPDLYDAFLKRWNDTRSIVNGDGSPAPLSLPSIRYSLAEQYLASASGIRTSLPAINGDRPNIWLYIHGPTHHDAISAKREADFLLPAAETFCTIEGLLGSSLDAYPQFDLTTAWEAQLYPDHGWGGKNGEITDGVFKAKYETARDLAKRSLMSSLTAIASRVKTKGGAGMPVVVFNALSWKRSGPARATVALPAKFAPCSLALCDHVGKVIPVHVDVTHHHPDGSIAAATLHFVAESVPSVGYATYYVRPATTVQGSSSRPGVVTHIENKYYTVALGPGGVQQITDKELHEDLFESGKFLGGELFTMQSIGEDAGEWDEPQQPTMEGFDKLSNHAVSWTSVEAGPVRDVVEARYLLQHVIVVQRITLYHTMKRIDFDISLLGWDGTRYREFRLAFPVRADLNRVAYEVPFGVVEVGKGEMQGAAGERYKQIVSRVRPRGIQNWIGASGNRFGITLSSSVAVWDYQDPTDLSKNIPLLQPVLLASRRSCHGEGPWYLQPGDHHYHFSLTSHTAGWRNGQRHGVAANAPLLAVVNPPKTPAPSLPVSKSFFSLDSDQLMLSTMKKSEDDGTVTVRVYNSGENAIDTQIELFSPLSKVEETNLLEEHGTLLTHKDNRVNIRVGRNAVSTFKLTTP
jgi:alpha-mannosidase